MSARERVIGQTYVLSVKAENALLLTDNLPADLRQCVHEYGYAIVQACFNAGVKQPNTIRQLVREIWEGARQQSQRPAPEGTLDWLLLQAGAGISAATLARVLSDKSMALVSTEPTRVMLAASMAECSGFKDRVTKEEKHRRRLRSAIKAGALGLKPVVLPPGAAQ